MLLFKCITCLSLCENLYWEGEVLSACEAFQALYDSCDPAMARNPMPSTLGKLQNLRVWVLLICAGNVHGSLLLWCNWHEEGSSTETAPVERDRSYSCFFVQLLDICFHLLHKPDIIAFPSQLCIWNALCL